MLLQALAIPTSCSPLPTSYFLLSLLQRLLDACPESRGDLPADEMMATRREWYAQLAKTESQRAEFEQLASSGGAEVFVDLRRPQQHRDDQHKYALSRIKRSGVARNT